MARNLQKALRDGGASVQLASTLRVHDPSGDPGFQADKMQQAQREAEHLVTVGRRDGWQVWLTYHNYYKAPDLIGPKVSKALGIPYLLIEATRARKRLEGPWAAYAAAAEWACDAAHVIFYVTEQDAEALRDRAPSGQVLRHLRPFLPVDALPDPSDRTGPMLSVGMLRAGDKLASYKLIAETLAHLQTPHWHLQIAGDGDARADVAALMKPFSSRVTLLGALTSDALAEFYSTASLLIWPGVNEAFGLAYLEAQAAGIPVVAQNRPGVRDVLAPGSYPDVGAGPAALAHRIDTLLSDADLARRAAQTARSHVAAHHLIGSAKRALFDTLHEVLA